MRPARDFLIIQLSNSRVLPHACDGNAAAGSVLSGDAETDYRRSRGRRGEGLTKPLYLAGLL